MEARSVTARAAPQQQDKRAGQHGDDEKDPEGIDIGDHCRLASDFRHEPGDACRIGNVERRHGPRHDRIVGCYAFHHVRLDRRRYFLLYPWRTNVAFLYLLFHVWFPAYW